MVVRIFHYLLGNGNILGKRLGAGVDHYRGKTRIDTILTGLKISTMVQMEGNGQARILHSGLHQLTQVDGLGILAGPCRSLQNDRCLDLSRRLGNRLDDLHVVNIEGADGVALLIGLAEHFGGSYQWHSEQLLFLQK